MRFLIFLALQDIAFNFVLLAWSCSKGPAFVQRAFYLTLGLTFYDWTCVGPPIIYLNTDYAIRTYYDCISWPKPHEQHGEIRRAQGLLCGPWAPAQRGG